MTDDQHQALDRLGVLAGELARTLVELGEQLVRVALMIAAVLAHGVATARGRPAGATPVTCDDGPARAPGVTMIPR